jgi:hypothetical protein
MLFTFSRALRRTSLASMSELQETGPASWLSCVVMMSILFTIAQHSPSEYSLAAWPTYFYIQCILWHPHFANSFGRISVDGPFGTCSEVSICRVYSDVVILCSVVFNYVTYLIISNASLFFSVY